VQLAANGRCANAKSILELLALGAEGGTELVITASGDDAAAAVDELATILPQLV
jgi:phosphotransferase system HPr (HPr) family protein